MSSAPHRCIAFLRELGDHVALVEGGKSPTVVADGCASCARRLTAAVAVAEGLRIRPAVPPRTELGLDGVLERIAEGFAGTPVADALRRAPSPPPMPLPWPVQDLEPRLAAALREPPVGSPVWLDARLQPRLQVRAAARALATRRAAVLAASVALFALFGWRLGGPNGTSTDPEFVFVRVSEMPALMHPASVLRHGGGR